jgi:hypothetical protein
MIEGDLQIIAVKEFEDVSPLSGAAAQHSRKRIVRRSIAFGESGELIPEYCMVINEKFE